MALLLGDFDSHVWWKPDLKAVDANKFLESVKLSILFNTLVSLNALQSQKWPLLICVLLKPVSAKVLQARTSIFIQSRIPLYTYSFSCWALHTSPIGYIKQLGWYLFSVYIDILFGFNFGEGGLLVRTRVTDGDDPDPDPREKKIV